MQLNIRSLITTVLLVLVAACSPPPTSNDIQRDRQERMVAEGVAQVGGPTMKNFREFKLAKDIYEMRDQTGLVTYSYVENEIPHAVPGVTALGGKLTFFCNSIGYPIPYATQFSAPESMQRYSLPATTGANGQAYGVTRLPQAEPNGLFTPSSAEGTWAMCKDPEGPDVRPVYVEPRLVVSQFKFKFD